MAAQSIEGATLNEPAATSGDKPESTDPSREVNVEHSAPALQEALLQPAPEQRTLAPEPLRPQETPPSELPAAPYPNPTITPPEMVAPPSSSPEAPVSDPMPENPY